MTKKIIINLGLLLISGTVLLIFLNVWNYWNKINELQKVSNEILTDKATFYQTSSESLSYEDVYDVLPEKAVLYNDLSWDRAYKSVLFKSDMTAPPMLDGRFFIYDDIGANIAVIGKDIQTDTHDQKQTVNINGTDYEVIGVMGTDYVTKLDHTIWLLMNQTNINPRGIFTVDGLEEKEVRAFLGDESIWKEVLLLNHENVGILEAADRRKDYWIFPAMVMTTGIMFYIILLHRWFFTNANEIKTRKELGFSSLSVKRTLICKSAAPCLSGGIAAFIVFCIYMGSFTSAVVPAAVNIALFGAVWLVILQYKDVKKLLGNEY